MSPSNCREIVKELQQCDVGEETCIIERYGDSKRQIDNDQQKYEDKRDAKYKKIQLKINSVRTDPYFSEMQQMEQIDKIGENFLVGHLISTRMRAILVNWLFEIQVAVKLLPTTVHLAVGIIDRYLQINKQLEKERLQLVGIASLIIADKLDETFVLNPQDARYLCANVFSESEITSMELSIFQYLDCELNRPVSLYFVRRYKVLCSTEQRPYFFALYLLDLALINANFSPVRPSIQATAAIFLSMTVFKQKSSTVWKGRLFKYSNYTLEDILPICQLMAKSVLVSETSRFQAVREKFQNEMYESISSAPEINSGILKKLAKGIICY